MVFTGTVGVLVRGKGRGLLTAVAPEIDRLQRLGFRLSPEIRAEALAVCGEG